MEWMDDGLIDGSIESLNNKANKLSIYLNNIPDLTWHCRVKEIIQLINYWFDFVFRYLSIYLSFCLPRVFATVCWISLEFVPFTYPICLLTHYILDHSVWLIDPFYPFDSKRIQRYKHQIPELTRQLQATVSNQIRTTMYGIAAGSSLRRKGEMYPIGNVCESFPFQSLQFFIHPSIYPCINSCVFYCSSHLSSCSWWLKVIHHMDNETWSQFDHLYLFPIR